MKMLTVWFVFFAVLFGGTAGGYHLWLQGNPRQVLVVVDTSFAMRGREADVGAALEDVSATGYSRFALRTEKVRVHGWSEQLDPSRLKPFGPRDFTKLAGVTSQDEFAAADRVVLITNASESERASLPGDWEVVKLR